MIVTACDPGTSASALVVWDGSKVLSAETLDNEEILAALQAIIDEAGAEPLTDEQAERYEQLETSLAVAQRDVALGYGPADRGAVG